MRFRTLPLVVLLFVATSGMAADDWNQFRGPRGDGKSDSNVPVRFSETQNVKWKVPIHGAGWSSPVLWGDQIWLTTADDGGKSMFAVCLDLKSGKTIHNVRVFDQIKTPRNEAYAYRSPHLNSPATPTPFVEKGRVYVHFGTQGTACLDTKTGKKLWERRDLHCDHVVRPGSSPIVSGDSVFVAFDGIDKQFFVALNKNTGKTQWKRDRNVKSDWSATLRARGIDPSKTKKSKPGDHKKSFATAHIITHKGQQQLIAPAAEATIAYNPKTGDELWRVHHFGGFNVAARPLYAHGLVYVYTSGLTGHLLAIRPGGRGDVTKSHVAWTTTRGTPHIPCPLVVGDMMFLATTNGIARCLDAKTGEEIWKKRLGGSHWASPLCANGKIYFSNKEGVITVLAASRQPQTIVQNKMNASFIASPAIAGNSLILRSTTHLYCLAAGYQRSAALVAADKKPAPAKKGFGKEKVGKGKGKGKGKGGIASKGLARLGNRLKKLVEQKKLTAQEAIGLYKLAAIAVAEASGGSKGKRNAKPARRVRNGKANFYAIVIGRLKTKDVELGEFTLTVDHVTGMYGNRWVKNEIVGKTIKVTGVSGRFRDKLLLIRRGQTLKFRSGNYLVKSQTMTFGSKFHVLERARPFSPAAYGVPPKQFRGFGGVLQGDIVELGGYEVLLRVKKIEKVADDSTAADPNIIKGKLIRVVGLYQHDKSYKDLRLGDAIRVGVAHANRSHDEFNVTRIIQKLTK